MSTHYRSRWSDDDRYVGPLTFSFGSGYRHFAIMLSSGNDEGSLASFRVSAGSATVILSLPRWLVPTERKKVFPRSWDAATIARLGRDWYWDETKREYGVSLSDGYLSVHYGRQTMASDTEKSWGHFLPWTQWRHVRHSLYGLDGSLFVHMPEWGRKLGEGSWKAREAVERLCPTASFAFTDFDGEALIVKTRIEEREWLFGDKWCKWLSLFHKPKINRSLYLDFSNETGRRKGSWKGGTTGHAIDMLSGELHAAAFQRYCTEHEMTFMGDAPDLPPDPDPNADTDLPAASAAVLRDDIERDEDADIADGEEADRK